MAHVSCWRSKTWCAHLPISSLGFLSDLAGRLAASPHITAVFFLAIPILLASVVLPSIHTLPVTFVAVVATIVLMPRATYGDSESFIPAVIFLLMICALGYLGLGRKLEQALQVAEVARKAGKPTLP
ncbi:MAG: hypothetical protein U0074_00940 [Kouleothrix sp.]